MAVLAIFDIYNPRDSDELSLLETAYGTCVSMCLGWVYDLLKDSLCSIVEMSIVLDFFIALVVDFMEVNIFYNKQYFFKNF